MAPNLIPGYSPSRFPIVIALAALLAVQTAAAAPLDSDWELSKRDSKSGQSYELYQRDVAGSGYDRYRLEAVVDEPIERVIRAIRIRRMDDRYLGEGFTRTVLHRDGDDSVTYIKMQMSLVKDRDVALRSNWGFDEKRGVYRDEWRTANEEAPPLPDGVVRMTKSEGFWELTPVDAGHTRVVYESHADPGGRVPSWIANSILGDQVIGQIATLRRILDEHRQDVAAAPPVGSESSPN